MEQMKMYQAQIVAILENGSEQLIPLRYSDGRIAEKRPLYLIDYVVASYADEKKYQQLVLPKKKVRSFEIRLDNGLVYEMPYGDDQIRSWAYYANLTKGRIVNYKQELYQTLNFDKVFEDFLTFAVSEEGEEIIKSHFFQAYPFFEEIMEMYIDINEKLDKNDNYYLEAQRAQLEKSSIFQISVTNPRTIQDHFRNYEIFRLCQKFENECLTLKNEKKVQKALHHALEGRRVYPTQIEMGGEEEAVEEQVTTPKVRRSLCYIIGNQLQPLILMTDEPEVLDQEIMTSFASAASLRKHYNQSIREYIRINSEYLKKIREANHCPNYQGQVAILEKQGEDFKRFADGSYVRYPVIYKSIWTNIKKIYCSLEKIRKDASLKKHYVLSREEVYYLFQDLRQADFESQREARFTGQEYHALFSEHESKTIFFAKPYNFMNSKKVLDAWAKEMQQSPYCYDKIRFIMRQLRKKELYILEDQMEVIPMAEPSDQTKEDNDNMDVKEEVLTSEEFSAAYLGGKPNQGKVLVNTEKNEKPKEFILLFEKPASK